MKALILARVSSEEQENNNSLPAQLENITQYAKNKGFEIDPALIFKIVESSTKDTRKEFEKIIELINHSKEPLALITDTVDRLQRSFKESVVLDGLRKQGKLEIHFYREGLIVHKDSNSADLIRWDMGVMFARSYVLQLSDNIKRSIEKKLRNGEEIGHISIGYKRVVIDGKKQVVIDTDRAHHVQNAFKLYSTGNYSIQQITRFMASEGLTNPKTNKPLANSKIHELLRDRFYVGIIEHKGKDYPHKYHHLIDLDTFNMCQVVRDNWHKKPFKYATKPFVFRGLIKCGYCGCTVSTDRKKDKYNYLCCSKYKGNCEGIRVREEVVTSQIEDVFKSIQLPEHVLIDLKDKVAKSSEAEKEMHKLAIQSLRNEYDQVLKKLHNLLDLRINESITTTEYDEKARELKERQTEINIMLEQRTSADQNFGLTLITMLDLAQKAHELFKSSKEDQKRKLINLLLSNLVLKGDKLQYTIARPFDVIVKANKTQEYYAREDSNLRPTA